VQQHHGIWPHHTQGVPGEQILQTTAAAAAAAVQNIPTQLTGVDAQQSIWRTILAPGEHYELHPASWNSHKTVT
jgi:hypothetical protein